MNLGVSEVCQCVARGVHCEDRSRRDDEAGNDEQFTFEDHCPAPLCSASGVQIRKMVSYTFKY